MPGNERLGIDPDELEIYEAYHWLTRSVAPRPIAWVVSESAEGELNLAPFSYFNAAGANPPSVMFSPVNNRDDEEKDTLKNVRETGRYVINVVTAGNVERANQTSAGFPRGVSEIDEVGLTPVDDCVKLDLPRIEESPVSLECELYKIVPHGDGPVAAHYIIGEVVYFHVSPEVVGDEFVDPPAVEHCGRMGGSWYSHNNRENMFELERPD